MKALRARAFSIISNKLVAICYILADTMPNALVWRVMILHFMAVL